MKVGTVFFTLVIILSLIGSIAGASYYYIKSVDVLQKQVFDQLDSITINKVDHINSLIHEIKTVVAVAATHKELTFEELNNIKNINPSFSTLLVLDEKGTVITSTEKSQVGKDMSDEDLYKNAIKETYIKDAYISKITTKPTISVSTPHAGGVLIAEIDMNIFDKITSDRTGLGESGEIYLINKESYAITSLLFREDTFLTFKVDSVNSRNCLSKFENPNIQIGKHIGHEAVEAHLGYRGIKVLGSHQPIFETEWCLLAEIDEAEILGKQRELFREVALTIVIAIVIIFSLIGLIIGKQLDKTTQFKKQKKKL